jgi:transposase InsO family protein
MKQPTALTTVLELGTRLLVDGGHAVVVGLEADRALLRFGDGRIAAWQLAALLAEPSTRVAGLQSPAQQGVGAVLADLPAQQRQAAARRLAHVREAVTGYASGLAGLAAPGEPRPAYDPARPLADRLAAKAEELEVSRRTVQRWAKDLRELGPVALLDARSLRGADRLCGIDQRWVAMCRTVLAEHTDASRPTTQLLLERIAARCEAEFGTGTVALPGIGRARRALAELTRGSNALRGSTSGKRSIAGRPAGVYGRLRATRPGEYLLLDTTVLDVFAMEPVTLRWVRAELTVAIDLYSRCVTGLRLSPASTKAVDAAAVLGEALRPDSRSHTASGPLPYAGLPDTLATDATRTETGLPAVAVESAVVDHGRIYLSEHLRTVCQRLGISIQPARPYTPTDKAVVERYFKTLSEGLLAALPGYKGPDVHSRGKDPQGCAYYFLDELEALLREWTSAVYHRRSHDGLVEPSVPGLALCPREMLEGGIARAGRLRIPARADLLLDLLPVAWRTVQHYGVEVHGLRYNAAVLTGYRNRRSGLQGAHPDKWPIRYDPDDVSAVYFQDPADHAWHALTWEHAAALSAPFSAETLAYARRLALAEGRHVDDRAALAALLERWDAGLTRHPTERRIAVRASQQRAARLGADPIPGPVAPPPTPAPTVVGDDDDPLELAALAPGEEIDETDYYADALEVLP